MATLTEDGLRALMVDAISSNHPDVAFKLFTVNAKKMKITSAHTIFQAALASTKARHPNRASKLMDQARKLPDFSDEMQGDHLRDLANYYAAEGNYARAQTLLEKAKELHEGNKDKLAADELVEAKTWLYMKDPASVIYFEQIRNGFIERMRSGKPIDEQYLRNVSWWLMLASARFGNTELFEMVVHDLRSGMVANTPERATFSFVSEHAKRRVQISSLLLRFPRMRRLIARYLIHHSRG